MILKIAVIFQLWKFWFPGLPNWMSWIRALFEVTLCKVRLFGYGIDKANQSNNNAQKLLENREQWMHNLWHLPSLITKIQWINSPIHWWILFGRLETVDWDFVWKIEAFLFECNDRKRKFVLPLRLCTLEVATCDFNGRAALTSG